jgi:hypothetical protein
VGWRGCFRHHFRKESLHALEKQQAHDSDFSWFFQLWNWKLPLKLKLFIWLAGKGKILTWDSLRRRGWEGPGFCPLCRHAQEDIHHLLIHCEFSTDVWNRTFNFFKLPFSWIGESISDCFKSWHLNKSSPNCLAVHVSWHLWIERNKALFEDRPPSSLAVLHRVLATYSWQPSSVRPSLSKAIDLSLPDGHTLACFDGAALSNGLCCGAGGFSKLILRESLSGSSIVVRELTQKRSSWGFGLPSGLLLCGQLIICSSEATRESSLTGLLISPSSMQSTSIAGNKRLGISPKVSQTSASSTFPELTIVRRTLSQRDR